MGREAKGFEFFVSSRPDQYLSQGLVANDCVNDTVVALGKAEP
jgi:hypothetical protein